MSTAPLPRGVHGPIDVSMNSSNVHRLLRKLGCVEPNPTANTVPRLTVQRPAVDRGERGFSYHNPKLFRRALRDFEGATCFETSQSPVKNLASLNRTRGNEGRAESKSGTCMFHDREEGTTCWQSRLLLSLQNI